jgi:hypothetical protein
MVAAVVLAHVGPARAQAPTIAPDPDPNHLGQYVVTIVTPPVLDYGRTTTLDAGGNVTTTVLTQSTRGRIKGTSTTSGPAINGEGTFSGRVMTRQSQPFVVLRSVDRGDINGDKTLSVIRMAARLDGWGDGSRLVGQLAIRYCALITDPIRDVKKKICTGNSPGIDQAAPHLGTWEARLALDTSGGRVIGAGSIATGVRAGGTRVSDVAVSGSVSSDGLATVRLDPMDKSAFVGSVTLVGPLVGDADGQMRFASVHEVKGKLLGQSFDEVFDSVP